MHAAATSRTVRLVDDACYALVLGSIGLFGIAGAYYVKSMMGIDLMEGNFILHDLFF